MSGRQIFPLALLILFVLAVGRIVIRPDMPPADFTFNNATEIKSMDPAKVTGSPENRVINALFEGLVSLHPKTLQPIPGIATHWDISEDKKTYTFHLRKNAVWSNGDPITAHDFYYSLRRFLDPTTACQYAYQAWYVVNAKKYTSGFGGVSPGDRVEVELKESPKGSLKFSRGTILYGELVSKKELSSVFQKKPKLLVVKIKGQEQTYVLGEEMPANAPAGAKLCKQVLLDFREVGFKVIDDYTFETKLNSPIGYWLELMAFEPLSPVHQTCLETFGESEWTKDGNMICNGPFKVLSRKLNDRIRLIKNEKYWDAKNVRLNTVDILPIKSETTAYNVFATGNLDWMITPPELVLEEYLKTKNEDGTLRTPRNDINPGPFLTVYFYRINTTIPPLNDIRVRQALFLAIDREEVTRVLCPAGEQAAYSLVPSAMPGYIPSEGPKRNIKKARKLLAEAGYPDGVDFPKFEILINQNEAHKAIAELIASQWSKSLGIEVKVYTEGWASYLNRQRSLEYSVCRAGWTMDYLDPNTYLDMFITEGENNETGWSNARYDQLIADAKNEIDPTKRYAMMNEAEAILMDEAPIIPIYFYVSKNLVKPYVKGFYNNVSDLHPLKSIYIDHEATGPNDFMLSQGIRQVQPDLGQAKTAEPETDQPKSSDLKPKNPETLKSASSKLEPQKTTSE